MKKTIIACIITLISLTFCYAQKIEREQMVNGYLYTQHGKPLSPKKMTELMKTNPSSYKLLKKAKTKGIISAFLGGVSIGCVIAGLTSKKKVNWSLVGAGAGVFLIKIPIASSGRKNNKEAVAVYNASLPEISSRFCPQINIITNSNGLGVAMNF